MARKGNGSRRSLSVVWGREARGEFAAIAQHCARMDDATIVEDILEACQGAPIAFLRWPQLGRTESGSSERKSDGILSTSHSLRAESFRELSSAIPQVPVMDVELVASLENVSAHSNSENVNERP